MPTIMVQGAKACRVGVDDGKGEPGGPSCLWFPELCRACLTGSRVT